MDHNWGEEIEVPEDLEDNEAVQDEFAGQLLPKLRDQVNMPLDDDEAKNWIKDAVAALVFPNDAELNIAKLRRMGIKALGRRVALLGGASCYVGEGRLVEERPRAS